MSDSQTTGPISDANQHWSTMREAGTLRGLQFLWFVHRHLGRRVLSLLLYPVVLYFILFKAEARKASREFLTSHWRKYPERWPGKPSTIDSLRHFREFAESVVDKLLAWQVDIDPNSFYIRAKDTHKQLVEDPRGKLIIGSHLGNMEYCRGFMYRFKSHTINVLLHDRHAQNFVNMMRQMNPESRINVFQVDQFDIATILLFKEKIDAGEWLFIAGDRVPVSGTERTATVEFLGRDTQLPIGPYLLGRALGCPVKLMFAYKNYGGDDHRLYFDIVDFAEQIKLPGRKKEQALQQYAQQYANELENVCRVAPFQWFNFYPYWQSDNCRESSTP